MNMILTDLAVILVCDVMVEPTFVVTFESLSVGKTGLWRVSCLVVMCGVAHWWHWLVMMMTCPVCTVQRPICSWY